MKIKSLFIPLVCLSSLLCSCNQPVKENDIEKKSTIYNSIGEQVMDPFKVAPKSKSLEPVDKSVAKSNLDEVMTVNFFLSNMVKKSYYKDGTGVLSYTYKFYIANNPDVIYTYNMTMYSNIDTTNNTMTYVSELTLSGAIPATIISMAIVSYNFETKLIGDYSYYVGMLGMQLEKIKCQDGSYYRDTTPSSTETDSLLNTYNSLKTNNLYTATVIESRESTRAYVDASNKVTNKIEESPDEHLLVAVE